MFQHELPPYPTPIHFGPGCTRWPLSTVLAYEAACAGVVAPELSPDQERYLTASQLASRHGVGEATVWRRAAGRQRRGSVTSKQTPPSHDSQNQLE